MHNKPEIVRGDLVEHYQAPHGSPSRLPAADGELRRELGGVRFEYNVLGTRGPRKMVALVPAMDPAGEPYIFQPEVEHDSILDR